MIAGLLVGGMFRRRAFLFGMGLFALFFVLSEEAHHKDDHSNAHEDE